MIIRQTRDEGRSLDYDAKERNAVAPQSLARGALQSGDRAAAGLPDRAKVHVGANSPLRGRIFLWKTLLRPSLVSPAFTQPGWDGALRAACLVRLLAKGINHSRRRLSHSHPAKPPSRQRRFVQRFPGLFRASLRIQISQLVSLLTCSLSCLMMCCHYAAEVARADQLSARSWWSARKRRC